MDWPSEAFHCRRLLSLGDDTSPNDLPKGTVLLYALVSAALVIGSGLAAGLTLGLMSLDQIEVQVLLRSGSPKEQRLARAILPVIADPHWLLVTLLLCNSACFEALPLFLDALTNPVGAILISVTLILLFGEILPQAVCARHGLAIGAALGWPVRFFMYLTSPISWPLARALDWLLGKEDYDLFKRRELKALVDLHGADEGLGGKLSDDEVQIICGALDLTNKIAYSAMTPLEKVVMLSTEQRMDRATISLILASGHSRLPVYAAENRSDIIGLILVKELLAYAFPHAHSDSDDKEGVKVSMLKLRPLPRVPAHTRVYDLLKLFRTGRSHMVLLTQPENPEALAQPIPIAITSANGCVSPARSRPILMSHPSAPRLQTRSRSPTSSHHPVLASMSLGQTQSDLSRFSPPYLDTKRAQLSISAAPASPGNYSGQQLTPAGSDLSQTTDARASESALRPTSVTSPRPSPAISTAAVDLGDEIEAANGSHHNQPALLHNSDDKQPMAPVVSGSPSRPMSGIAALPTRLSTWRMGMSASMERASVASTAGTSVLSSEVEQVEVPPLANPGEPIGIITIEDVLEELMGQEILDETDHFADNECTQPVDEEVRAKMAQKLPELLRTLVLGTAGPTCNRARSGMLRQHSGGARGGSRTFPSAASLAGMVDRPADTSNV